MMETDQKSVQLIYRSALDCVKRLGVGGKDPLNGDQIQLREKLCSLCDKLIFLDPLKYGRKAEDTIWTKCFYEPVQQLRKNRTTCTSEESQLCLLILNNAYGYYQSFIHRVCFQFGPNLPYNIRRLCDFAVINRHNQNITKSIATAADGQNKKELDLTELLIASLHRAHIYAGDLMRYKLEMDRNEQQWSGWLQLADRAYRLALTLRPTDGMPFNQLGTLYADRQQGLHALFYYLRASFCSTQFDRAGANLKMIVRKTLTTAAGAQHSSDNSSGLDIYCSFMNFASAALNNGQEFASTCISIETAADQWRAKVEELCDYAEQENNEEEQTSPTVATVPSVHMSEMAVALCMVACTLDKQRFTNSACSFADTLWYVRVCFQECMGYLLEQLTTAIQNTVESQNAQIDEQQEEVNDQDQSTCSSLLVQAVTGAAATTKQLRSKKKLPPAAWMLRRRRGSKEGSEAEDSADADSECSESEEDCVALSTSSGHSTDNETDKSTPAIIDDSNKSAAVEVEDQSAGQPQPIISTTTIELNNNLAGSSGVHSPVSVSPEKFSYNALIADWLCASRVTVQCARVNAELLLTDAKSADLHRQLAVLNNLLVDLLPNEDFSDEWRQTVPLLEDLELRDATFLTQESGVTVNMDIDWTKHVCVDLNEQCTIRVRHLMSFTRWFVAKYPELLEYSQDGDNKRLVVLETEDKSKEPTPTTETTDEDKHSLMRQMARLRADHEMARLQHMHWVPVYVVPDSSALLQQLALCKQLVGARKFVMVVSEGVLALLDAAKKENPAARDAIRWLESCAAAGSKFLRQPRMTEWKSVPRADNLSDDLYDVMCVLGGLCSLMNAKTSSSSNGTEHSQSTVATLLTASQLQSTNFEIREAAVKKAELQGVSVYNVRAFLHRWDKQSRNRRRRKD